MRLLGFPLDLAISQWQPGDRDVADFPLPIVEWPQVQATVSCSSSVTAAGNAVYGLDNVAYVAMDTIPAGNGLSGTQTVRVLARLDAANIGYGLGAVTAKIELWNNGSYVATLVSDVPVKSDVGQIITAYWDSLLLRDIDPTGANVEYKVYGYYNLGSRSLEIGAVEWEASYIPTPALASGSGAVVLSHSSVLTGGTYGAIPVATDDFNRGSIGANWLQLDSFWGVIATSGTVAYGSGSAQALPIGSQARWVGAGTFAADQYSQAAIGGLEFQSGNYHAGVLVRCSTDADSSGTSTRDFYGVSVLYDSAGPNYTTKLYKVVNGVLTTLYSASVAWSNGDVLKLTVVGSTLTAYKNGVAISGFSATDTDLSSGNPGIEAASNGTANETLDNWEGGSYAYSGIKGALAAITVSSASSVAAAGTKSAVATAACSCSSSVACVGASSHAETSTISSASGVSVVGAHAGNVDVSVPATATVTPVVTTARSEGASVSSTSSVSSGDVKNAAGTAALSSVSSVSAAGVKNAGATASCSCTSDVTCTGAGAGAVVDETATVTVVATAARAGTASVPETAASAITAAKGAAGTAAISCTSSTSCTTAASHTETSTVPCTATVAVTGLHAGTAAVSVSAASSVSAQGVKGAVAAISLSAASATACSGRMGARDTTSVTATATITVAGQAARCVTLTIPVSSLLAVATRKNAQVTAAVTVASALTAGEAPGKRGAAVVSVASDLAVTGARIEEHSGSGALSCTSSVVVTGVMGARAAVALASTGTVVVNGVVSRVSASLVTIPVTVTADGRKDGQCVIEIPVVIAIQLDGASQRASDAAVDVASALVAHGEFGSPGQIPEVLEFTAVFEAVIELNAVFEPTIVLESAIREDQIELQAKVHNA